MYVKEVFFYQRVSGCTQKLLIFLMCSKVLTAFHVKNVSSVLHVQTCLTIRWKGHMGSWIWSFISKEQRILFWLRTWGNKGWFKFCEKSHYRTRAEKIRNFWRERTSPLRLKTSGILLSFIFFDIVNGTVLLFQQSHSPAPALTKKKLETI